MDTRYKQIFKLILILISFFSMENAYGNISFRGVVYDVGLNFGGNTLSVNEFDSIRVDYDMNIIKNILRCNTVRIEGESIDRLVIASKIANKYGLNILFNPWMHEANPVETIKYMEKAAEAAEILKNEGVDLIFVAGCEYSLFNYGVIPGNTFNDRFQWVTSLGDEPASALQKLTDMSLKLNDILRQINTVVRRKFSGKVTYSSGTWETVDWGLFDIVGIDYYHGAESDDEYVAGIDRYRCDKPVIVMEMGCCAYKGAALLGSGGFAVFQGTDSEGNPIYMDGKEPQRSEAEQANYVEKNIWLLEKAGVDGVCVYVFSYPVYPYRKDGIDFDRFSYALVKSYDEGNIHWKSIPSWTPKQAFYRLGSVYSALSGD